MGQSILGRCRYSSNQKIIQVLWYFCQTRRNRERVDFYYHHLNTSPNQITIDAEVEDQTLREFQENVPPVNNHITTDEQIGDNHYDENELNYANLWDD